MEIKVDLNTVLLVLVLFVQIFILFYTRLLNKKHAEEKKKLYDEARLDPLTGLKNRIAFMEALNQYERMLLTDESDMRSDPLSCLSVLFIDLDSFKQINDTYGHDTGDDVLKAVAEAIKSKTRFTDTVCRFGGEEIVVILPNFCGQEANDVAEKIREEIESLLFPMPTKEKELFQVTASIGVASSTEAKDPKKLISIADKAMYEAKEAGKNRVVQIEI